MVAEDQAQVVFISPDDLKQPISQNEDCDVGTSIRKFCDGKVINSQYICANNCHHTLQHSSPETFFSTILDRVSTIVNKESLHVN